MSIIVVYAPTNESESAEEPEKFYQTLQKCVAEVPKCDVLLVMGDFNAPVGNDMILWQALVGRFGTEERNENGLRLLDFSSFNDMITNTFFQHRPFHILPSLLLSLNQW